MEFLSKCILLILFLVQRGTDFIEAQIPMSVVNSAVMRMRVLSVANKDVWLRTQRLVTLMYQYMLPYAVRREQEQRARAVGGGRCY